MLMAQADLAARVKGLPSHLVEAQSLSYPFLNWCLNDWMHILLRKFGRVLPADCWYCSSIQERALTIGGGGNLLIEEPARAALNVTTQTNHY